ncbi:helix-turn-helix transcriptional regulator [Amycolatopsis panacis]|uniref:Helix-turn-helix transcriptional regulator n=2 Tax=Amycolatopsis panacis TaxID=2340917 RepID=A0A419IBD3_9PSEU|nr:helix-turn-helix transcriptional regulator [Amycolatopsis panacis]
MPHTKLVPPPLPSRFVERPALRRRLVNHASSTDVTLLCAPPGYGKSTLLADWIRTAGDADRAWVSLDRDDDAGRFLTAALLSLGECGVVPAGSRLRTLSPADDQDPASLLADLVNAVAAVPARLYLVLDDVQEMSSVEVRRVLAALIRHQPGNLRLVLASQSDPPLPLARWRVQGRLAELRADELCFSLGDASRLIRDAGVTLTGDQLRRLVAQTEGWAAGLRLAARSLRTAGDPERLLADLAGGDRAISDFLAGEVLAGLPPDTRRLLRLLSPCDQVDPRLAALLSGQADVGEILAELERTSSPMVTLGPDRRSYSIHPLLRCYLRADLVRHEPRLANQVHARASAWYAAHRRPAEALRHAEQNGDEHAVVALLRDVSIGMLLQGRPEMVRQGLASAGAGAIGNDAVLLLCSAFAHLEMGELSVAESDLARGDAVWPASPTGSEAALRHLVVSAHALALGRKPPNRPDDDGALASGPSGIDAWLLLDRGLALAAHGDRAGARSLLRSARESSRAQGFDYLAMHVRVALAVLQALDGDYAAMETACAEALAWSRTSGWPRSPWLAPAEVLPGLARLLRSDPSGALESSGRFADAEPSLVRFLARLVVGVARFDLGDRVPGARLLQTNRRDLADDHLPPELTATAAVLEHQCAIVGRHLPVARDVAEWSLRRLGAGAESALLDARTRFVHGDLAGTRRALEAILSERTSALVPATTVEAWLLDAATSLRAERRTSARESLSRALSVAERSSIVRPFAHADPPVHRLLLDQIGGFGHTDAFAERVRQVLTAPGERADEHVLTGREQDVLARLILPQPLEEVASDLRVSVNTVKTHVRAIYAKLGVNSRRAAVVAARERGLA